MTTAALLTLILAAPAPLPRASHGPPPWPVGTWVKPLTYAEGECWLVLRPDRTYTEQYPGGRYDGTWRLLEGGSVMQYGRETYGNDAPCWLLSRVGNELKPSWGDTRFRRVR